jgi:hypothetical protein
VRVVGRRVFRNANNRPVRKLYRLQSKSTTAYKDTPIASAIEKRIACLRFSPRIIARGGNNKSSTVLKNLDYTNRCFYLIIVSLSILGGNVFDIRR